MIVAKLTVDQAESIRGVQYAPDSYFNPIQDANDNWIISMEEVEQCDIDWVKTLPQIEHIQKTTETLN